MPSVKTWRELLRTPSMRSSQNSPSETVWKSGIALSSGCHLWVKGCEEALFGRLQRSDEDDGDPLQLFSKQFRKGNSPKFVCRILHKSRPWDRIGRSSSHPTHSSQHYMLWRWIEMRDTLFCSALRATDNKPTK